MTRLRNITNNPKRVFDSRAISFEPEDLPFVSVRTGAEQVVADDDSAGARILTRQLVVEVAVARAANTDSADSEAALAEILDSDCRAVELAVAEDETLNRRVQHIILASTAPRYEANAETPVGIALLTFIATYEAPAQETVLPEFALGTVRWDLATPDGHIDAEDNLDVQE